MVSFRDRRFAEPKGLMGYVVEQGSFAKVRPDMSVVFVRELADVAARLKATTGILRSLVGIATRRAA